MIGFFGGLIIGSVFATAITGLLLIIYYERRFEEKLGSGEKVCCLYNVKDSETQENLLCGIKLKRFNNLEFDGYVRSGLRKYYRFIRYVVIKGRQCEITYFANYPYKLWQGSTLDPAGEALGLRTKN